MATESSARDAESHQESPSSSEIFSTKRRFCFCMPYRWQKVPSSLPENRPEATFWSRSITALKKIREWTEIVAGPRWKTFIRRFNRSNNFGRQSSKYQYDPLSYALNFDQGPLQNCDPETENEYMIRNFSSRYVSPAPVNLITPKVPVDLAKNGIGPSFV